MKLTSSYRGSWSTEETSVLKRAWKRLERDMAMTLSSSCEEKQEMTSFLISKWGPQNGNRMEAESYNICVSNHTVVLAGADELGIIYGLLYISEKFLGITPFWYWNDQIFHKKEYVEIAEGNYQSPQYRLRYRGWFINDEVLLDAWKPAELKKDSPIVENEAWEMVMEALLRLGGNMIIPGTDHNSHKYRQLAVDMGLWVTHHHAEPLGAEMFSRVYPDLTPSYAEHASLFHELWHKAIEEQKENKTIWNLGFRGQGDKPFWSDDPSYDTLEKRGTLISNLILEQYKEVASVIENPVCCTNLYGEVMELYQLGYIKLPESVIAIWADNGYGKMVSRRQGNHNPRVVALPKARDGRHGIYYHASFYDLQAASHITMLPNSTEFVKKELENAIELGVHDFIIVNCSNVKPHTYILDTIAQIWGKQEPSYVQQYFPNSKELTSELYQAYFAAMLHYGQNEDDRAGEQFYHYTMRSICQWWSLGKEECLEDLIWLTGDVSFEKQIDKVRQIVSEGISELEHLNVRGREAAESVGITFQEESQLIKDSIVLQAVIHYKSACALLKLCLAFSCYRERRYEKAFLLVGNACEILGTVLQEMKKSEHGKWKGFYANDCLTDVKFTIYTLESVMRYIRSLGDGPYYYQWALKYCYGRADYKVVLITNMRNHPRDWELYLKMKSKTREIECDTK